ncbi:hypothetical protein LEL_04548 [Akanthomyces lecanii RCEF 1005]|uniref:C2H2-type domain-containing protein n=1 Tax=Akanthomyces lecanii RCEF 1005 TaxID=1081108 RepID=A0A168HG19_CORDF|nr:hypothetical protein LEL_04548 [Akanthomyces lecanii RCEF 1005]
MDIDEHYAPFPGARATPSRPDNPHADVEESYTRAANRPSPAYQNATAQKARPAGPLAAQPVPRGSTLSAPAPVSVVLRTSPIKVHEYSEYDVAITEATTAEDEPPRKKRGRPKGWKAGLSYAEMRGGVRPKSVMRVGRSGRQTQAPDYRLKRRRKTAARSDSPQPRELYLALKPVFTRFLCEWSGCQADLHNMDTMRRHVHAVHLRPQHQQHCCLWGKCAGKSATQHDDAAALAKHMERAHLVPMAWHVGDGPRNSWDWTTRLEADGEAVPDFLKDSDGNQVTPSTRDQEVEDILTYRNNRRKLKDLIMRRDENLESQSSGESEGEDTASGL